MDEIISPFVKFLSNTIMVQIHSYPNFSMETILSTVVCVVHCLLIFEVNSLYRRTNAKAAAKLRMRHPIKEVESCSYHTMSHFQTQIFPQKIETTTTKQSYYVPYKRINKKVSTNSNFGWVVANGDSVVRHSFNERVEHLLSISPSEYVRKDKERKSREAGLRTCIQSLTSLLERALNTDNMEADLSKDAIKKSINAIRENFETHISRDSYPIGAFASASLQSLIANNINKKALWNNSRLPQLEGVGNNIDNKMSEGDVKDGETDEKKCEDSLMNLINRKSLDTLSETKSVDNLSQLINETFTETFEIMRGDSRQQQHCFA